MDKVAKVIGRTSFDDRQNRWALRARQTTKTRTVNSTRMIKSNGCRFRPSDCLENAALPL
jgi:hypothetical protein